MEDIIVDIGRGNKQAFKELFDDYYLILYVLASYCIEDKEVCKDIAQGILLAYWKRKEDLDDILKVRSSPYTVTRDKRLDHLEHEQLGTSYFFEQEKFDSGLEVAIIEQEIFYMVRKAVEELPTQTQNTILYSMRGLRNHEIVDKLQISEGTVHTLKKFVYRKLHENLKGIDCTLLLFLCK